MPLPVSSPLSLGEFLDGLEVTGQVQSFAKLRIRTHSVVPYLKAPLVCADPPGDCRRLASRVINGVVQHLSERVTHDLSGRTLFVQVQILSDPTPHDVLGEPKQREVVPPGRRRLGSNRQRILGQRTSCYRGSHGSQVKESVTTRGPGRGYDISIVQLPDSSGR